MDREDERLLRQTDFLPWAIGQHSMELEQKKNEEISRDWGASKVTKERIA
jgi:hypothetical protein